MVEFFISYSWVDEEFVNSVCNILDKFGCKYFRDKKDINWGQNIAMKVPEGIHSANSLLVVVTQASIMSAWVMYEVGVASALEKNICPILQDPSINLPDFLKNYRYIRSLEELCSLLSIPTATQSGIGSIHETINFDFAKKHIGKVDKNLINLINEAIFRLEMNHWTGNRDDANSVHVSLSNCFAKSKMISQDDLESIVKESEQAIKETEPQIKAEDAFERHSKQYRQVDAVLSIWFTKLPNIFEYEEKIFHHDPKDYLSVLLVNLYMDTSASVNHDKISEGRKIGILSIIADSDYPNACEEYLISAFKSFQPWTRSFLKKVGLKIFNQQYDAWVKKNSLSEYQTI